MYDPDSGEVFGQRDLEIVKVPAPTASVAPELLGMGNVVLRELGGIELSGYDMDTSEAYTAGSVVPTTLLWRIPSAGTTREYEIHIRDEFGKSVAQQKGSVGGQEVAAGQYIRQDLGVELPVTLPAGKYAIQVSVPGGLPIPLTSNSAILGTVEVNPP
jgi:hypothetical protein